MEKNPVVLARKGVVASGCYCGLDINRSLTSHEPGYGYAKKRANYGPGNYRGPDFIHLVSQGRYLHLILLTLRY